MFPVFKRGMHQSASCCYDKILETISFKGKKRLFSGSNPWWINPAILVGVTHHRRAADGRARNQKMRNPLERRAFTDLKPSSIKDLETLPSNPRYFGGHLRAKLKNIWETIVLKTHVCYSRLVLTVLSQHSGHLWASLNVLLVQSQFFSIWFSDSYFGLAV